MLAPTVLRLGHNAALLEEPAQAPEPDTPRQTEEKPEIVLPADESFDQLLQDIRIAQHQRIFLSQTDHDYVG